MTTVTKSNSKVQVGFTDKLLTGHGGAIFLRAAADRLGLPRQLAEHVRVKQRRRGVSEDQMLLALIGCISGGDGSLVDLDRLAGDEVRKSALGLDAVADPRRVGELLARFGKNALGGLRTIAHANAAQLAPAVIKHYRDELGYVPLFVDGTAIEVGSGKIEGANKGYNGEYQYWWHATFIGDLMVTADLHPGGTNVTAGFAEQLAEAKKLIPEHTPVWAAVDNAYYDKEFVRTCDEYGWDYSISVTHGEFQRPLLRAAAELEADDWAIVNDDEAATIITHRPHGWHRAHQYVVIKSLKPNRQGDLFERYSFILVSRKNLSLAKLIARHRRKQGCENHFKGPLIDLDLHHPPCRKLNANRAYYLLGLIAAQLLTAVKYLLLPICARTARFRTLIRDLIRLPALLTRSGRRTYLRFSRTAYRPAWIAHAAALL